MLRGTSYIPSESTGGLDVTGSLHLAARQCTQETPRSETAIPGSVVQIQRTSQGWHTEPRAPHSQGPAGLLVQLVLTWLAHEMSQLHLNVPLLLLQLLLFHPGRNHRSDELLLLHAPGLDPSHIVQKLHHCIADHLATGGSREIFLHHICKVPLPTNSSQTLGAHQCSRAHQLIPQDTSSSPRDVPKPSLILPIGTLFFGLLHSLSISPHCSQVKCISRRMNFTYLYISSDSCLSSSCFSWISLNQSTMRASSDSSAKETKGKTPSEAAPV